MNTDVNTIRFLGAAFLFVFFASLISEWLLKTAVKSNNISDILIAVSENVTRLRISNLIALINSLGIIVLAALLYMVFQDQFKPIALIALGMWLVEATALAISK